LTYANDVITVKPEIRDNLERTQNEMGRFALGVNRHTANEGVQGEMGWNSFEAREAQAKMQYFVRINRMDIKRYARQIYNHVRLEMKPIESTSWFKRTRFLERKYVGEGEYRLLGMGKVQEGWEGVCQKRIKETAHQKWEDGVKKKNSLQEAYHRKKVYERVGYLDNGRGSSLLAQARTGSLITNRIRSKYLTVQDECGLCGETGDTTGHIILNCRELNEEREGWEWPDGGDDWEEADKLGYRLGFEVQSRVLKWEELNRTKKLLNKWEIKLQQGKVNQ
jgi:hypothetical protein